MNLTNKLTMILIHSSFPMMRMNTIITRDRMMKSLNNLKSSRLTHRLGPSWHFCSHSLSQAAWGCSYINNNLNKTNARRKLPRKKKKRTKFMLECKDSNTKAIHQLKIDWAATNLNPSMVTSSPFTTVMVAGNTLTCAQGKFKHILKKIWKGRVQNNR